MPIKNINLALSNRCNATCIWCPTSRGTKHNFDMPFETLKKLIDEVSAPGFPWAIGMIHLSENGEALYNKDFLKITRYIKEKLPNTAINLLSNFSLLTPKISKILLEEKLLSSVQVNIDGHDKKAYESVKGISYKTVIKHVKAFIELRAELDPTFNFTINVMPAFEYVVTVSNFFNTAPDRADAPIPFSDFEETNRALRKFVPHDITISHSKSGFWAERKLITSGQIKPKIDQSTLNCPLLNRVKNEAFIAPNGDWYPCCLDDNNDIVLGNINDTSILEIHDSDTRKVFIENLIAHKYEEIGYPCNTVICCQTITLDKNSYIEQTKHFKKGDVIVLKNNH